MWPQASRVELAFGQYTATWRQVHCYLQQSQWWLFVRLPWHCVFFRASLLIPPCALGASKHARSNRTAAQSSWSGLVPSPLSWSLRRLSAPWVRARCQAVVLACELRGERPMGPVGAVVCWAAQVVRPASDLPAFDESHGGNGRGGMSTWHQLTVATGPLTAPVRQRCTERHFPSDRSGLLDSLRHLRSPPQPSLSAPRRQRWWWLPGNGPVWSSTALLWGSCRTFAELRRGSENAPR